MAEILALEEEAALGPEEETSFIEESPEQRSIRVTREGQIARRRQQIATERARRQGFINNFNERDNLIRRYQSRFYGGSSFDNNLEQFRNETLPKTIEEDEDAKSDLFKNNEETTPKTINNDETSSEFSLRDEYNRNNLRRFYEERDYDPNQIDRLVNTQDEINRLIRHYGYEPEEFEILQTFFPEEIPEELEEELEELHKDLNDQTLPKSLEAEKKGILKPSKRVTFDDINSEGFRSNFRRQRDFSSARSTRSSYRSDVSPKGAIREALGGQAIEDLFYTDYGAYKTGQGLDQIFSEIKNIYQTRRNKIEVSRHGKQVDRNRRVLGIVLNGESRDDLIANNEIPSYYSTSNIKRLLRDGVMPFGWNAEMAVQQGFGDEINRTEIKEKTKDQANEFLHRETVKAHLKATEGDLKNLRNRLKSRKLIQYYSQF